MGWITEWGQKLGALRSRSWCWGLQGEPEPAPPVPGLGLEGNSLPVSRVLGVCLNVTEQIGPEGVSKVEAQKGAAPGWAAVGGRQVEAHVRLSVLPGLAGRAPTFTSFVLNSHQVSSRLGRKWSHTSHKQLKKVEVICL